MGRPKLCPTPDEKREAEAKRATLEHWNLSDEARLAARNLIRDDLIFLRRTAAIGGIEVGTPGPHLLHLVAFGFLHLESNGDAHRARATVTMDGLRALCMRSTTADMRQVHQHDDDSD